MAHFQLLREGVRERIRTVHISLTFLDISRTKAPRFGVNENAGFCCQVPADPACQPARAGGLQFPVLAPHYAARATGALWLSLATISFRTDNGGTSPSESTFFTPPSILFRPHAPRHDAGVLVEAPGTAPGSDGFITMTIYRHSPYGRIQHRHGGAESQ